jgi:3-oxoacyl-[acyl-carrier protein] reductase
MGFLEERLKLDGKVAAIVGGAGGLGEACALDLAGAGVSLGICDKDQERLERIRDELARRGCESEVSCFDARDPQRLDDFYRHVAGTFGGRLDVLCNVVGGTFRQPFLSSTLNGWSAIVNSNFLWLLSSIQLAVHHMENGASIVNFTSIEAHRAAPGYAVYGAMKAAVTSLTSSLAVELAPQGIRVNALAADMVPTEGMQGLRPAGSRDFEHLSEQIAIPMGRKGNYGDIGGCLLFLASDLSRYVTGTTIHPDGGAVAASGWFNWPDIGFDHLPSPRALGGFQE